MRTYQKLVLIGIGVLMVQALAGVSSANSKEVLFSQIDANQDGLVSLREASGYLDILKNFTRVDINEDGFLSLKELQASALI